MLYVHLSDSMEFPPGVPAFECGVPNNCQAVISSASASFPQDSAKRGLMGFWNILLYLVPGIHVATGWHVEMKHVDRWALHSYRTMHNGKDCRYKKPKL